MPKHDEASFHRLYQVLAKIQNADEMESFLEDLCTITELVSFAQRLDVARCLDAGMNYSAVTQVTGVSSATISRVNRCLNYGTGGYQIALEKLKEDATP